MVDHFYNLTLQEASPQRELGPLAPVLEARRILLSILPRILACMTSLWKASNAAERNENYQRKYIMGSPKVSKVSSITLKESGNFHFNRISGVMVSMLASSAVDSGFEPLSGQTKDYKNGICCFSSKQRMQH